MSNLAKDGYIKFQLSSWLENAAICGLINILGEDNVVINEQDVEVSIELLKNFEESYFSYFATQYKKLSSLTKILNYEEELLYNQRNNFDNFDFAAYERLQKYLLDLKRYGESNSYKAVYPLINSNVDILALIKRAKITKFKPRDVIQKRGLLIEQVKQVYQVLDEIFLYYKKEEVQRYLGAKIQIYAVINKAYNDISFLNRQESGGDFFKKYHDYFIESMFEYLNTKHEKDKLSCTNCDRSIKNGKISYSFLNQMGYDVTRKQSNSWSFVNDLFMCPVCRLLYTCIPAGFTYVHNHGMFVNCDQSVRLLVEKNEAIRTFLMSSDKVKLAPNDMYSALIRMLDESTLQEKSDVLNDLQVVRYENGEYFYDILSQQTVNILRKCRKHLAALANGGYAANGEYHWLYKEVVDRLVRGENLFPLIDKTLREKLFGGQAYFNSDQVMKMILINNIVMEGAIQ